ncbi:HNH endonuclease [Acinetobacter sichuanensis]|uniref:HNH endonuclease n=1 Tax=Acinetobacter sichuanensis TaxID=2136183 RepID=A0A371YNM6_9GAMM|nr:HNH endonuclease [Acinetobacter sichuanensis]RFC83042.1 HNH endonuclease [Acinetobacter sichuanensis]
MLSIDTLKIGHKLTNHELYKVFGCGNSGGMRRAKKTNSLIIISSHVESIYEDRWDGDILLYTGMGLNGDQSLDFNQNKTLNESSVNGVQVCLFEQFKVNEYTYLGPVDLIQAPYTEKQPDQNGQLRTVYIFPLKLKTGERYINQNDVKAWQEKKHKHAKKLSQQELLNRALKSNPQSNGYKTTVIQYVRNEYVSEYAKRLANGICQLCNQTAPFEDKKGMPYLETHHIAWLARGGEDTIFNTVALCPNCHKRIHILDLEQDKAKLLSKIQNLALEN